MDKHKRYGHKKNEVAIRAWRVWENGNLTFGKLGSALGSDSLDLYRRVTGVEYNGPMPFYLLIYGMRKDELLEWAAKQGPKP